MAVRSGTIKADSIDEVLDAAIAEAAVIAVENTIAALGSTLPVKTSKLKTKFLAELRERAVEFGQLKNMSLSLEEVTKYAPYVVSNMAQWEDMLFAEFNNQLVIQANLRGLDLS